MKKIMCSLGIAVSFMGMSALPAVAGPPFTNIEGVGGVALNPLAFVANGIKADGTGLFGSTVVSKPNIGYWHIGLGDSDINWEAVGANMSFWNVLEIGYGHEFVSIDDVTNVEKNNFSAKVNFLKEGDWYPALAVGAIYKDTNFTVTTDDSDYDYYAVASKHLMDLPMPIVLSAGVVSTKGYVRGVLGFGDDRDEAFFGNFEILPTKKMDGCPEILKGLIVGIDYLDGTTVGTDLDTHAVWNAHVAWMYKELTLIAAYVDSGSDEVRDFATGHGGLPTKFGDGWCLSMQYQF
ncbi:MAG: DUF3034 family protein [Desulfocapsaceae bacterium]|nr:DUF3034 family protein [Desulfocapsaceae bacterium]